MKTSLLTNVLIIVLVVIFGMLVADTSFEDKAEKDHDKMSYMPAEIVADFVYTDNLHEYSGVIEFPNPCYELYTEALVRESYPEQITLSFVVTPPAEDVMCAQVITPKEFRILVGASEQATVDATYNGKKINLIIVESNGDASMGMPADGNTDVDEMVVEETENDQ